MSEHATLTRTSTRASDARAIDAIHKLVATPSVSGSERTAVEQFVQVAEDLGFQGEIDGAGNGIAQRGPSEGARVTIALLGHIDTVPGQPEVRLTGDVLHGRGSVDAKGPLCAMLFGAARAELPSDVSVIVISAVGEETPESPGARFLRERMQPDGCIIGEPSGWDGVTLGYKGRLVARARCERSITHTAGPARSASDEVLAWHALVEQFVLRESAGASRAFDAIQMTVRSMSSSSDGLREWSEIEVGFRLPVGCDPHELEGHLRELADDKAIEIDCLGHEVAHVSDRNDPVVRALSLAIRDEGATPRQKVKTGTADLNVVAPIWDCPIAAYGPGDSALDHTPHEHLPIEDYLRAIRVVAQTLGTLGEPGALGDSPQTCG